MATIKSFSDLEQSRKLAEILPLESADMHYCLEQRDIASGYKIGITTYTKAKRFTGKCNIIDVQPSWSLAALLDVLPQGEYEDTDLCFGGYQGDKYIPEWFCSYEQQEPFIFEVSHADNPVDACVAMIERLHGLKML